MRQRFTPIAFLLVLAITFSCKKDNNTNADCFPNKSTVRQIANAQATVEAVGGKFYIVEQGAIDTRLNPCSLPEEFQVDNLPVTISGDVKFTDYAAGEPCCTENLIITKIAK